MLAQQSTYKKTINIIENAPDTDRNKLLPKQSVNLLPDAINSAGLTTFDTTSPVPSSLMSNASALDKQNASMELKTISPKKKTIFATRFAVDTNVEDMKFYILSKIKNCNPDEILLFKINSRKRGSFKIIVPDNLFQQIVNPEFWPKHALVREFIYSESNIARLPTIVATNQKKLNSIVLRY